MQTQSNQPIVGKLELPASDPYNVNRDKTERRYLEGTFYTDLPNVGTQTTTHSLLGKLYQFTPDKKAYQLSKRDASDAAIVIAAAEKDYNQRALEARGKTDAEVDGMIARTLTVDVDQLTTLFRDIYIVPGKLAHNGEPETEIAAHVAPLYPKHVLLNGNSALSEKDYVLFHELTHIAQRNDSIGLDTDDVDTNYKDDLKEGALFSKLSREEQAYYVSDFVERNS